MKTYTCDLCGKSLGELWRDPSPGKTFIHGEHVGIVARLTEVALPKLPEGWVFDYAVQSHRPDIGVWWVVTDTGLRVAWNEEKFQNANGQPCPNCLNDGTVRQASCRHCAGRGVMDSVPYADRPWDLVLVRRVDESAPVDPDAHQRVGELWLGGIQCQFGGVATGPEKQRSSDGGNCHPRNYFDVVVSLAHEEGFEPTPPTRHYKHTMIDGELDPDHHSRLDYLAERIQTDVENGERVLVRCLAGLNRSALLAGLVMIRMGYSVDESLEQMRRVRSPFVLFNRSFVHYLRQVEHRANA